MAGHAGIRRLVINEVGEFGGNQVLRSLGFVFGTQGNP